MIELENSELAPVIMRELQARFEAVRLTEAFGPAMLQKLSELLENTRTRCRQQNIDFPAMTVLILPSVPLLHVVRADLDRNGLHQTVLNLKVMHPQLTMLELARAVSEAFPGMRPEALH